MTEAHSRVLDGAAQIIVGGLLCSVAAMYLYVLFILVRYFLG
jgi:hypothetical protein